MTLDPAHSRILVLAAEERRLRNSPRWNTHLEEALEAHSDAVERLYEELYRQVDAAAGALPEPAPRAEEIGKTIRRELVARIRSELPGLVASVLDD